MSVEPLKMAMREQHMKNLAEHKKFKESLTPSEQMDYQTFGKEYVLRGRDPAEKEKRDTEIEEKRQQLKEEREEKVYGKELRITGQEGEEELETKVKARAQKDDEEYLAEKEKEKKLNEERKAKRLERMEANWKVSMTVKDMIALLRENKVYGYGGKKKAELIEMIEKNNLKGGKKEEPKVEEQPSPAQKVRDISTTGDDRPLWEKIMKMRSEMMAFDALPKRAKALEKAYGEITEDFDTTKLEKLSGDPEFVKKLLKQENYEEDFKRKYKEAKRVEALRAYNRGESYEKKSKDELKTMIDEKLQEEYKENRREIARQLINLYEEMASMKKRDDFEKTDWFDALDTGEYPEITTLDIGDLDIEEEEDEDGNEYARTYKKYTRDVYKPKNAPFNLVYQYTTEVRTYNKDEDGDWDFSGEVEEDELDYDDDRGYYLERKY